MRTALEGCVGDCTAGDYFGWLAGVYDQYRPTDVPTTRAEIDALLAALPSAGPGRALDVMCGPGRHALELLARGWEVVGVDATAPLLDLLRAEADVAGVGDRLSVVVSDAYAGALPGGQDLAYVLGNSFGFGAGAAEGRALLHALRGALRPGGTVAIETFDLVLRRRAHATGKRHALPGGQVLRKSFSFDEETSVEHASVDVVGAGTHERTCYRQLVPSREALSAMLGEAGFVDVRSCAGWPSDDSHVLVARAPARGDR